MAGFEIDPRAKPYVPGEYRGRFWANAEMAFRWAGLLLLLAVIYGIPIAAILLLLR